MVLYRRRMQANPVSGRPLRFVFAPFGSEGDLAPLMWLGDRLLARGHVVRVAANPYYETLVRSRGHVFLPVGDAGLLKAALEDERIWEGPGASRLLLEGLLGSLLPIVHGFMRDREPVDLVVGTSFAVGAQLAAEAKGVPFARIHLQPSPLRSAGDLPVAARQLAWLGRMPPFFIRCHFKLLDLVLDGKPLRRVNEVRGQLGLRPFKSFYDDVCQGGAGLAAMFPDWYAPVQPEWPRCLRQFGFPVASGRRLEPLAESLQAFLEDGAPPVVWTHGSANFHTAEIERAAEAAMRSLGVRGVVIGPRIQESSSPGLLRLRYAPFDALFPRCRAVVHHGGIGTMVRALRAGVPQLIIPRAFDQFDNAARAVRLGFAKTVDYRQIARVPDVLRSLLADDALTRRSGELGANLEPPEECVAWLEGLATGQGRRP